MKYTYLLIPGIVILLLPLIAEIVRGPSVKRKQKLRAYYAVTDRCDRVLGMKTADPVFRYMEEYSAAYQAVEPLLEEKERAHYRADIRELEDYLSDLEQEHWQDRAQPHLQEFMDCYYLLQHESFPPQKAQEIKRKCIREWQAFYAIPLDKYHTRIMPGRFFKEMLAEDYDDCMSDRTKLERRLNNMIRSAKA